MGAGLLGAIAGAGQGAIDKSDRMRQDTLMEEDNAIWEARQVRLSEIRGEEADQAQGRADASESARYARGMQDKKSLLAEERKYQSGQKDKAHMQDIAMEGVKSSLRTAEDKAGISGGTGGASGAATNAFKQYRELRAMGKSHDKSLAIAYKTIKSIKDDMGMTTGMVDIASNQLIGMIKEQEGGGMEFQGSEGWTGEPPPARRPAPKIGEEKNGYRFMGGDPTKQENWKPIK